jgi:hypothetical protein
VRGGSGGSGGSGLWECNRGGVAILEQINMYILWLEKCIILDGKPHG